MRMFDLHTHVLPGVDDGAANRQEALGMLKNAAASQVAAVVATPHCNVPGWYENYKTPELMERFRALAADAAAAEIPVKVLPGMEVHATPELPRLLREGKLLSLNGSRYVLTEFPMRAEAPFFTDMLQRVLAEGYLPLVAHPERYPAVQESPRIVRQWLDLGCHVQLTAGSILGEFGVRAKRTSDFLLREDLVACVASDAHGVRLRTNFLGGVFAHLQLHYSKEYAQILLWDNPLKICSDELL